MKLLWWAHYSTTDNFKDCIIKAVNRKGMTQTRLERAVAGMIAGRHYGLSQIPKEFTSYLMMYKDLYNTAIELSKLK